MADKYWQSKPPTSCDLVGYTPSEHKHGDVWGEGEFVDGKTCMGPWANMCMKCHRKYGMGLGTGLGQHYRRQLDNRWLKVGG
jgi:hypothetical protein